MNPRIVPRLLRSTQAPMTDGDVSCAAALVAVVHHEPPWPAQRLLLAVLDLALRDYRMFSEASNARSLRLLAELREWFLDEATASPFAFVTICDALSLDAEYIRAHLWRLQPLRAAERIDRDTARLARGTSARS